MWGLDLLALPKYADMAHQAFPVGFALGVFSNTFGDSRGSVKRILRTGRCPRVRVHLAWKDRHNFSKKDFRAIEEEAKKWQAVVRDFPACDWQFSGACEHHLSPTDSLALANVVLSVLPGVTYVNVGDYDIEGKNLINEVHGNKSRVPKTKYNFSYDGQAVVDANIEKDKIVRERAVTFWLWEPRFNGRYETNDTTPRPLRRGWPDQRLIKSVVALTRNCGDVGLPAKWIYKSHAENKGTGDIRAEKPVIIAPLKTDIITLNDGARLVSLFRYFGPYSGGGHRYYESKNKWGYEIAQKPLSVRANEKCYGFVNPAFRFGAWR